MKYGSDPYLFINTGGTIYNHNNNRLLLKTQRIKFVYDISCSGTTMLNWKDESKLTFNRFISLIEQCSGTKIGDTQVFYFFRGRKIRVRNEADFLEMKRACKGNDLDVFVNTDMGYTMNKIVDPGNKFGCSYSTSRLPLKRKLGVLRFFRTGLWTPCVDSAYRDV